MIVAVAVAVADDAAAVVAVADVVVPADAATAHLSFYALFRFYPL